MNQVNLVGRISKEPQLRYTQQGTAVLNFTLAVEGDYYDEATKSNKVDFVDCVLWGKSAENRAPHMFKGMLLSVSGSLNCRIVERDGGVRHNQMEVRVDQSKFLESKRLIQERMSQSVTS